jgi:ATPase subunit of ABC transporter with duplicated ATPase domains
MSPGERKRWQIAAALAREPDVLLLDEPSNHLDARAREWLVHALSRFAGVGVVVSHDRELLDRLTSSTIELRAGDVRVQRGGYTRARDTRGSSAPLPKRGAGARSIASRGFASACTRRGKKSGALRRAAARGGA